MTIPPRPDLDAATPALSPLAAALELARVLLLLALTAPLALVAIPLYALSRLLLPRPPILPSLGANLRLLARIWGSFPAPGLPFQARVGLSLCLIQYWMLQPIWGLGWYLDELLYGRAVRETEIKAPLFELSAARSGSTQLARYLEADPLIVAPSVLQIVAPFIWAWKLAGPLSRVVPPAWLQDRMRASQSRDFLERHEYDPLLTDTYEVVYGFGHHYEILFRLGAAQIVDSINHVRVAPGGGEYWGDLVQHIDQIGRKAIFFAGPGPDGAPRRLLVKGHFLAIAEQLEARYPDACFLTVLRAPDKRLSSVIHHYHAQPVPALAGPSPWGWIVDTTLTLEPQYNEAEMAFFTKAGPARRVMVRFDDYVRDLEGTMRKVYQDCLDQLEPSPHVPRVHAPRAHAKYSVDYSLAELGVDRDAFLARNAAWTAWVKGLKA